MTMTALDPQRVAALKPSFAIRRVDRADIRHLDEQAVDLQPGDVVIARVTTIGQHAHLERPDGRRAKLFPGDEILVACGARYAPDQFEADCPGAVGAAELVAAGGIVGHVRCTHERMRPATSLTILGAVGNQDGRRVNLADYAVRATPQPIGIPVVAVCGTAMNAGKTHTLATVIRSLSQTGHKVAAIKVTGTGAGGDLWSYVDSGAHLVRDFTDAGFATTYHAPVNDILDGFRSLAAEAQTAGANLIAVEVADGLHQAETAGVLRSSGFRELLSGVVFAAGDAMGAEAGVAWLQREGHRVLAVTGLLARSPLAVREAAAALAVPCLTPDQLLGREMAAQLAAPDGGTSGVHDAA